MDFFSFSFIIFLFSSFALFYLTGLINSRFKKTIIPQWFVLLIASLFFYGFVNWIYLLYLAGSFTITYIISLICQYSISKHINDDGKTIYKIVKIENHLERRKFENIITAIAIIANVGVLATLKYFNFFISSINSIFNLSLITFNFIVPLGISFYTFSLIAYNVDCCKRVTIAEKNPLKFLLFVSYFPKILQGPISSYDKLKEDGLFACHRFVDTDYLKAFFRISIGLVKKIAIANVLNIYVNASYSNLNNSFGWSLLLTSVLYTIQLYCDFSGFADITIGVSGLFGIKLEENFNIPYISSSITEFWRRWHITLGAWLKKYIYIPLGGNRVPIWRWIINTLIVWLVSGIWHGANWTFIIWGLFHGVLIVLTGLPRQIQKKKNRRVEEKNKSLFMTFLSVAITFVLVNFGWVLFRASNIREAARFMWHAVKVWVPSSYSVFTDASIAKSNWLFIVSLSLVIVLIILKTIIFYKEKLLKNSCHAYLIEYVSTFSITVIFAFVSIFIFFYLSYVGGGESSFIYFDF